MRMSLVLGVVMTLVSLITGGGLWAQDGSEVAKKRREIKKFIAERLPKMTGEVEKIFATELLAVPMEEDTTRLAFLEKLQKELKQKARLLMPSSGARPVPGQIYMRRYWVEDLLVKVSGDQSFFQMSSRWEYSDPQPQGGGGGVLVPDSDVNRDKNAGLIGEEKMTELLHNYIGVSFQSMYDLSYGQGYFYLRGPAFVHKKVEAFLRKCRLQAQSPIAVRIWLLDKSPGDLALKGLTPDEVRAKLKPILKTALVRETKKVHTKIRRILAKLRQNRKGEEPVALTVLWMELDSQVDLKGAGQGPRSHLTKAQIKRLRETCEQGQRGKLLGEYRLVSHPYQSAYLHRGLTYRYIRSFQRHSSNQRFGNPAHIWDPQMDMARDGVFIQGRTVPGARAVHLRFQAVFRKINQMTSVVSGPGEIQLPQVSQHPYSFTTKIPWGRGVAMEQRSGGVRRVLVVIPEKVR